MNHLNYMRLHDRLDDDPRQYWENTSNGKIRHKAYTQDQPCPIVCRVRVRPQQRGFFRCRAFRNRAHQQVEKPCSDIEHIKNQKDQHGQDHMPPRPPPEAQDFPKGEQHSETTEQPHPCRLDRLLTLVPRPAHVTSYAVGETCASMDRRRTSPTCMPLCSLACGVS